MKAPKYFIPYSVTRCFSRDVGYNKSFPDKLALGIFIVMETISFPFTPLLTWAHWMDYKKDKGEHCHLMEIYNG